MTRVYQLRYRSDQYALERKAHSKGNWYGVMTFTNWDQAVWTHPVGYPHWNY